MDQTFLHITLPIERATERLASLITQHVSCATPLHIYLQGELGTGKTAFCRYFLKALGCRERVKSPTFSLLEVYVVSSLKLYHFDFYRINYQEEFLDAGFVDYFSEPAICLVEWPEKVADFLPVADLSLHLEYARATEEGEPAAGLRLARLQAAGEWGQQCLMMLTNTIQTASFV